MDKSVKLRLIVSLAVLAAAGAMTVFGLLRGDHARVLSKAAAVCLECVGIG